MLTNIINRAFALAYGQQKAEVTFSTDQNAAITSTITSAASGNNATVPNGHGLLTADVISIENADVAGTGPWVTQVTGNASATQINLPIPSVRTAVTNAVVTRWERFEVRYRPSRIRLINLTTGDVHEWIKGMPKLTVMKSAAAGGQTFLTNNSIWVMSNVIGIHPNLLPVSNSFLMELDFEYRL